MLLIVLFQQSYPQDSQTVVNGHVFLGRKRSASWLFN